MLDYLKPERVLFLDIETVPALPDFSELDEGFQKLWEKKSSQFRKEDQTAADVYGRAGIYAEFGKVICISFGMLHWKDGQRMLRVKSLYNDNEYAVLKDFSDLLIKLNSANDLVLCGHNGKEFDFPYISRRMLINNIALPTVLDVAGRKPWETQFVDTLELWKFGDYKNYTSLELLTKVMGIPSPKNDIDGSMVAKVYYQDKDLERIARYCCNDVVALVRLLLKFKGEKLLPDEQIEIV